ncbi:MAG: ferritin-like domain-containing protein [Acidobacteriota bacterium]|nr:MAG: ferritin-like domain-containing protein [Acidobacteriota bacterium]
MRFETSRDVLDWYERQPRALTPEFIASIPWDKVKDHPFDEKYVPVLFYMRDVETLTDMYHRELLRTPTGKDPDISKFMERWGVEEITHGEVMNRFLNELGYETDEKWQTEIRDAVTKAYQANAFMITTLTNLIGKKFTATHMTFGAIHEMEAAQGYRRLKTLTDHPVLNPILDAIIREESAHNQFYWSVAKLELTRNKTARRIARFVTERFWAPVGQGSLAKRRTQYLVSTLFSEGEGIETIETKVTQRVRQLPGFEDITKITDTISNMAATSDVPFEAALP